MPQGVGEPGVPSLPGDLAGMGPHRRAAPIGQDAAQERDDLMVFHVPRRRQQADGPRPSHRRDEGIGQRGGGVAGRASPGARPCHQAGEERRFGIAAGDVGVGLRDPPAFCGRVEVEPDDPGRRRGRLGQCARRAANRTRQAEHLQAFGAIRQDTLRVEGFGREPLGQATQGIGDAGRQHHRERSQGRHVADLGVPLAPLQHHPAADLGERRRVDLPRGVPAIDAGVEVVDGNHQSSLSRGSWGSLSERAEDCIAYLAPCSLRLVSGHRIPLHLGPVRVYNPDQSLADLAPRWFQL